MRGIILGEIVGTCIMILLGNGVVANVNMDKSGMKGGGSVQVTIAWGLAVMIPAYIFGDLSGAHFNPAVTLALAMNGGISWGQVPVYFISELLGAMLGALLVYLLFKDHFDANEDKNAIRSCFCTSPSIPNKWRNLLSEIIGTFVLVFAIIGFEQIPQAAESGVNKLLLYGLIVSIGMSFGGLTGYAINPARDLGPRIVYSILPFKNKTDSGWDYAAIPIIGPLIGSALAVLVYNLIFI